VLAEETLMNRIWRRVGTLLATGLVASAAVPACATNDSSVFIRAALAPSPNRQNNACVYTPDPQQPQLMVGTLDIGVRDNYLAVLLVGNQMIARGDPALVRAESNRFHINGAVVRVTEPGGEAIHEFTSVGTGLADPAQNNAPGYGLVGVTLIDAETRNRIGGQVVGQATKLVVAHVKVFGRTLGGDEIETGEFQLPINICNGCLVTFAGGDDPAVPGVDCLLPLDTQGAQFPCTPGQDELTPCQYCVGRPACDPANR
jgi:hypothetical protein